MSASGLMGWGTSLTLSSEALNPLSSLASFTLAWGFGPSSERHRLEMGRWRLLGTASPGRGLPGRSVGQAWRSRLGTQPSPHREDPSRVLCAGPRAFPAAWRRVAVHATG